MATTMEFLVNDTNSDHDYEGHPTSFGLLDLVLDYLVWTAGDDVVKDLMTDEPTSDQLNAAASIIDEEDPVTVALCLWVDYSHDRGGSYWTHKVLGMGENKRYSFCFSFDGATAMIPRLEAWDTNAHSTIAKHVLGAGTPANSFVKAVRTTYSLPGTDWVGTAIAGLNNYINLDTTYLSGAKDLYANIKIKILADYSTPSVETFVITTRFTYF